MSKITGYSPGEVVFHGMDVHIYKNQIDMVRQQLCRTPMEMPELNVLKDIKTFEDMLSMEYSDIELIGYEPYPDIKNKPKMAV